MRSPLRSLADWLSGVPVIGQVVLAAHKQYFASASGCQRLFYGTYETFEEARQAAPRTKPLRYDDRGYCYSSNHRTVHSSDYPLMFWLSRMLREESSVLDFGGNVGMAFYSFSRYLNYPENFRWLVYDLPEVVQTAIRVYEQEGSPAALSFTSQLSDCQGCEVFLASGSLQYVPETLPEILEKMEERPKYLLVNKLPAYDGTPYVTVQNTGTAFSPYRVVNGAEFVEQVCSFGYSLRDKWLNPDLTLLLPGSPAHSLESFCGMYFEHDSN